MSLMFWRQWRKLLARASHSTSMLQTMRALHLGPPSTSTTPHFPTFSIKFNRPVVFMLLLLFIHFLMFCQSSGRPSWCSIKCSWQSWKRLPERFLHGKAVTALRSATRCRSVAHSCICYNLGHIMCFLNSASRLRVKSCWGGTWLSEIFVFWSI